MSAILLPRRFRAQPSGEIQLLDERRSDCDGVWVPGVTGLRNLVSGVSDGVSGDRTVEDSRNGLALIGTGSTGGFYDQTLRGTGGFYSSTDASATMLCWMRIRSFSGGIALGSLYGTFRNWGLSVGAAGVGRIYSIIDGTGTDSTVNTLDRDDVVDNWGYGLAVARVLGTQSSIRWFGEFKRQASDGTWSGSVGGETAFLCSNGDRNGGPVLAGGNGLEIYAAAIANRAIPDDELEEIYEQGYGWLVKPKLTLVGFSASAAAFDAVPSAATVQSITSTGATPKCTITRTGSSPAGTLYYVIYPDGLSAPSAAQVIAGQDSTGSAATASGNEACRTTNGDQVFASPASGLTPSTAYRIAFVASDGVTPSSVAVSASAFTTSAAAITLTGASVEQAATTSQGAVTQAHLLVGAGTQQTTETSQGAVSQAHVLLGSSVEQSPTTTQGSVSQSSALVGASVEQSATTSQAAITQEQTLTSGQTQQDSQTSQGTVSQSHVLQGTGAEQTATTTSAAIGSAGTLSGSSIQQSATTSQGAISQTHILVAAAVAADAEASSSAIVQAHILQGSNVIQVVQTTQDAIDLSFTHNLGGSAVEQAGQTSSGAVTQTHVLTGAGTQQTAETGSGAITQAQTLAGAGAEQTATTSQGAVSQNPVLVGSNVEQAATTSSGAVDLSFTHNLAGSAVSAYYEVNSGTISQTHILTGAGVQQTAKATGGSTYTDVLQLSVPLSFIHQLNDGIWAVQVDDGVWAIRLDDPTTPRSAGR